MAGEAELVLLGIQAAIRLNEQYRKGFADSVRNEAITVPLPNFNPTIDSTTAIAFYMVGAGTGFVNSNASVGVLIAKVRATGPASLSGAEENELLALYREHDALLRARDGKLVATDAANPALFSNSDVLTLLEIRQWRKGQNPNPSMLQRMAGTFISIAVDYFANHSPLISSQSPRGKALLGFLQAIEPINFAEGAPEQIVQDLFVAAVETVSDNVSLISGDQWAQALVHDVAAGLYTDAKQFADAQAGNLSAQERVSRWSQLVFRSVLKNAGESVFSHPGTFFDGLSAGEANLVSRVGRTLLGAVVTQNAVQFDHLFTPETLDAVTKASFAAVAAHPELVSGGNDRLKKLIGEIAGGLASTPALLTCDFVPEAIRIIIQKTGENLEALMPTGTDPARNLLLVASKEVLALVSAPPPAAAKWRLQFGPAQLEELLQTVVATVAANPDWLIQEAGGANTLLGSITKAVLDSLRRRAGPLLRPDTALLILKAAYGAAGKRLGMLAKNPADQHLIGAALDAVFATIFDAGVNAEAKWVLVRDEAVARVATIVLDSLARHGINEQQIQKVVIQLRSAIQALGQGQTWTLEGFAASLDAALAA